MEFKARENGGNSIEESGKLSPKKNVVLKMQFL